MVNDLTDEEIVAQVRAGDREAYRGLVLRYQDVLYRHALRMTRQPDLAADMVQGTFVKGFTELDRCRDSARFGGWLFRILANACRDHLMSAHARDVSLDDSIIAVSDSPDALRELERKETRALLAQALAQLPVALRESFVLKHVEGLDYAEMAELLGSSVPALKMRVHRAREALQAMLVEAFE